MNQNRIISMSNFLNMGFKGLPLQDEWKEAFGCPHLTGAWIVWGSPGNGKTRFAVQLGKHLSSFGRVAYNSLEEGRSLSLQSAFKSENMQECSGKMIILDKVRMPELMDMLDKRRSPDIVIIDSIQYMGLTYAQYTRMIEKHRNKLFILISHADGKRPEGRIAKSIHFDAFIKIWVEGFRAFPVSRYGGGSPYTIWPEGAEKYWKGTKI